MDDTFAMAMSARGGNDLSLSGRPERDLIQARRALRRKDPPRHHLRQPLRRLPRRHLRAIEKRVATNVEKQRNRRTEVTPVLGKKGLKLELFRQVR